ncbi:MAG: putative deoxyribonuclease YcfH, partial [Pseudomonadota bacterium]
GKTNNPSYVPYVAQLLGELRGVNPEAMGELTTRNFLQLFSKTQLLEQA